MQSISLSHSLRTHLNAMLCGLLCISGTAQIAAELPAAPPVQQNQPKTKVTQKKVAPPVAPAMPAEFVQKELEWRAEKGRDIIAILERLQGTLSNPLMAIIKNYKLVPSKEVRLQAEIWIRALNDELRKLTIQLRAAVTPSVATLQKASAAIALYIEIIGIALDRHLSVDACAITTLPTTEAIATRIAECRLFLQTSVEQNFAAERAALSAEQRAEIPENLSPEMVSMLVIEQFIPALASAYETLTLKVHDYGITSVNNIARSLDLFAKKVMYHKYTAPVMLTSLLALSGYAAYSFMFPKPGTEAQKFQYAFLTAALGYAAQGLAQTTMAETWKAIRVNFAEVNKRFAIFWKKMQGLPVKETVNGFEILQKEACEGEEQPVIGLEIPFNRVMESVESALRRLKAGERDPFKGLNRLFMFFGVSGGGKTFLAEQLKFRIARLREILGIDIAFEHVGPEQLVFGDIMMRIREAQEKGIGLILWIDEVHLMKPTKDGNASLLSQLLKAEAVNKSDSLVFIFAATNEPGRVDNAVLRDGRFVPIHIYEPNFSDRVRLFDHYLRQQGLILKPHELNSFAAQTSHASPATIRKCIDAARTAGRVISQETVQAELMRTVFRVVPGFEMLSTTEQREIAAYQSGRALVHVLNALESQTHARELFKNGKRFALVTAAAIEQPLKELGGFVITEVATNLNLNAGARRSFGKLVIYEGREDICTGTRAKDKERAIRELFAGACAQEILLHDVVDEMRKNDYKLAYEACLDLACAGMPLDKLSKKEQERCKERALELFNLILLKTKELLTTHTAACKAMVTFMLQNKQNPHIDALNIITLLDHFAAPADKAVPAKEAPVTIAQNQLKQEESPALVPVQS